MIDDKPCGIGFLPDVGEAKDLKDASVHNSRPSKSLQVVYANGCKCVLYLKYSDFLCDLFVDLLECAVSLNLVIFYYVV